MKQGSFGNIAKLDMVKVNPAGCCCHIQNLGSSIGLFLFPIQKFKDSFGCCRTGLDKVQVIGNQGGGAGNIIGIDQKGLNSPDRQGPSNDKNPPHHTDTDISQVIDQFH